LVRASSERLYAKHFPSTNPDFYVSNLAAQVNLRGKNARQQHALRQREGISVSGFIQLRPHENSTARVLIYSGKPS
jgi:hypothetical protein